jgi:hypothetical protein
VRWSRGSWRCREGRRDGWMEGKEEVVACSVR